MATIKAIDKTTIHHITSGQVVIDLQTAVKELLENSIDAGATNIEVRFKQYGLSGLEVVDNGCGIAPEDHDGVALKHHTSKLTTFSDLESVGTFGFRGEALSSLCALSGGVTVTTATASMTPKAVCLVVDSTGKIVKRSSIARQQGTTVSLAKLFSSLAVRRKEFEKNVKREFGKALTLLSAYALCPCASGTGIRLSVSNQPDKGQKTFPIKTLGTPSFRASVTALWGPKADDTIVDMGFNFEVERERLKRGQSQDSNPIPVKVQGLISKFTIGAGRSSSDRQFLFINGRPCEMPRVQKAFNEVYRSFNANQSPFILADFVLPTDSYDVNVSPDKRSILLHNEANLIAQLKLTLEDLFSPSRSTYNLSGTQSKPRTTQTLLTQKQDSLAASVATTIQNAEECGSDDVVVISRPPSSAAIQRQTIVDLRPVSGSTIPEPAPASPEARSRSQSASADDMTVDDDDDQNLLEKSRPSDGMEIETPGPSRSSSGDDMIIDSSQTSWSRRLGIVSPNKGSIVGSSDHLHDATNDTRRAKKPKTLQTQSEDDDKLEDEATAASTSTTLTSGTTQTRSSSSFAHPSTHPSLKRKPSSSISQVLKKRISTTNSLRSQLATFAAPGSQPTAQTLSAHDADEDSDEELEQLDENTPEADEDLAETTLDLSTNQPSDECSIPRSGSSPAQSGASSSLFLSEEDDRDEDPDSILSQAKANSSRPISTATNSSFQSSHPEFIRTERAGSDIVVKLDIDQIRATYSPKRPSCIETLPMHQGGVELDANGTGTPTVPEAASILNVEDGNKADEALSRVINKKDFNEMEVVGQFNLGFIIARRKKARSGTLEGGDGKGNMDDLFIVDQHAADEKYNFETLQATTKIESQKLVRPRLLELPAADEMLVMGNLETLRQSGFEIEVDQDNSATHGRLRLTALPTSKNTVFDVKDLEEIVHLMQSRPTGEVIRCSKARAMFAMRACRKSVMVGMPLTTSQMTTVVRHMGTMDQPWNCPHGRPTMRHLCDLRIAGVRSREKIDWSVL